MAAAFRNTTFSHSSYATFRPSYPPSLYQTVLAYHSGPRSLCVDLGTGHGVVARALSKEFAKVIGSDPSNGMVTQAKSSTSINEHPNVDFVVASAESLPFLGNESVDIVVAAQAAHWFDYPKLFAELRRVMKSGGTLAFWGYKDHIFPSYPKASKLIVEYAYGKDERLMGPYWEPGRFIVQNKLRAIKPPTEDWDDIQRIEYEPGTNGPKSGEGTCFMDMQMTLGQNMDYIRTWSAYHVWQEKHPDGKPKNKGGSGDLIDEMFEKMLESEEELSNEGDAWKDKMVDVEWGTALILARKK